MRNEKYAGRLPGIESSAAASPHPDREPRSSHEVIRVFGDVWFDFGSATLPSPSRTRLDQLVSWLQRAESPGDTVIEIRGQFPESGEEELSLHLGRARAEVVRHYLSTRMRWLTDRIQIVSAGALAPAAIDDDAGQRPESHRAVVLVLR